MTEFQAIGNNQASACLLILSNELLSLITWHLTPAELVPLLKANRALYHRIIPILWQHIQFFDPTCHTDFRNFSNINHRYLTLPHTSHRLTKSVAVRVNPALMQMDKLSASLYMGHVSDFALSSIQQLTLYTQNRFAGQPSFAKFVEETLLQTPGKLTALRTIRVINDASGVIPISNPHHFDDHASMATLIGAIAKYNEWTEAKCGTPLDIFLYARNPKLVGIVKGLPSIGSGITFFHMEFAESADDTLNVCNTLEKMPRLRVFSLVKAKLRRVFSHHDSAADIEIVCTRFMNTLNNMHELESISIVSSLLIMNLDFTQLPRTLQNLELNNQTTTFAQYRNLGPVLEDIRTWRYFLSDIELPPRLHSLRLSHISKGSPLARIPIIIHPNNKFVNLTELNLIGNDMPPGSDVQLFRTFQDLIVVTINSISHTGFQTLVETSASTLRELTVAKADGDVVPGHEELFHDESVLSLRKCSQLEYLYLNLVHQTLRGETMAAVLKGCPRLTQVYFEYTGFSLSPTGDGLPPLPDEYPKFGERVNQEWVDGKGLVPTKKARFTKHPDDKTAFIECIYLIMNTLRPVNIDGQRYTFRDYRIKPHGFGAGGIYMLDTIKFNSIIGNR